MKFKHTLLIEIFYGKEEATKPLKTENTFLNPTDDFGKMKTGVADETQDYKRQLPANGNEFEIINAKQK